MSGATKTFSSRCSLGSPVTASHHRLAFLQDRPAFLTPGYPLLIANVVRLFGTGPTAAWLLIVLNVLLSLVTLWLWVSCESCSPDISERGAANLAGFPLCRLLPNALRSALHLGHVPLGSHPSDSDRNRSSSSQSKAVRSCGPRDSVSMPHWSTSALCYSRSSPSGGMEGSVASASKSMVVAKRGIRSRIVPLAHPQLCGPACIRCTAAR